MQIFKLILIVLFIAGCSGKQPEPRKIVSVDVQKITVVEPCDPPEVVCDLSITVKSDNTTEDKQVIGKLVSCISEQKRALYTCSKKALDAKMLKNTLLK